MYITHVNQKKKSFFHVTLIYFDILRHMETLNETRKDPIE